MNEYLTNVPSYAAFTAGEKLKYYNIKRRNVGPEDILINILYCGVCHTDIHYARNDWNISVYPLVPGHEIVGRVLEVGNLVKSYKKNDLVGVGVMVNSCQKCFSCKDQLEQYCDNGATFTYNATDKILGGVTYGGYSKKIVVNNKFVLKVSEKLDAQSVAPLLCAGITTYSPLRHWKVRKGQKVGIIGLGGLGHLGVKFASAMGAKVVVITTSDNKTNDAKRLGADEVLISKNKKSMESNQKSFDFLLNTVPVPHDLNLYVQLLKRDKTMVIVGAIEPFNNINIKGLIFGRKSIAGSLVGGIRETQEMLDFCAKNNIVSDAEIINIKDINTAYKRIRKSDVKYRFVIDMKTL